MTLIKKGTKLTKYDLESIASFFRIVKNYVKMKELQGDHALKLDTGSICESDMYKQATFHRYTDNKTEIKAWYDGHFEYAVIFDKRNCTFHAHSEVDGSTWFLKNIKDLADLKNVYEALTDQELKLAIDCRTCKKCMTPDKRKKLWDPKCKFATPRMSSNSDPYHDPMLEDECKHYKRK